MKKIWEFIKKKFLTKKFIQFCLIGIINTGIDLLVYWICAVLLGFEHILPGTAWFGTAVGAFLSSTTAFITASVFSYFANVLFTFKPVHRSALQFSAVMGVFLVRLVVAGLLTAAFDLAATDWFMADYAIQPWARLLVRFLASAIMIPIAYFALEYVFKKTDVKKIS